MKLLSRADEILMVSIACLGEDAYSTTLLTEIRKRGGKSLTVGSLWVSLDQLSDRGLVRKKSVKPSSGKGGKPRIYYSLSPRGVRMLLRTKQFGESLWTGVPDLEAYSSK